MDKYYMDYYTQEFEIEFRDEAAAAKAQLEILPLLNGKEAAISSRWDDNILTDLKMREVLEKHGYRGTFYLNASAGHFYYGKDYGHFEKEGKEYGTLGKRLLQGGNSIGGHSLTHPHLTRPNRNRIFEEVMGIRADRESDTDSQINSYAFSFCDFRNDEEGDVVQEDIGEALRRAGYFHIANHWYNPHIKDDFQESKLVPGDGAEIDKDFARFLADKQGMKTSPNISFCMHVWYETPEAWGKFEGQLKKYGGRENWWYCNQGEYAAYHYQYMHSSLEQKSEGSKLKLTLKRPELLDLNDVVPLTFRVKGVAVDNVVRVIGNDAKVSAAPAVAGAFCFNLHHDSDKSLPAAIAWRKEGAKEGKEFPFLVASLQARGDSLRLSLKNSGKAPLEEVRLTYRLPLAYKNGVVKKELGAIAPGGEGKDGLELKVSRKNYKYRAGKMFYLAQLDFKREGKQDRVYLSCYGAAAERDASYPQGGFHLLGPIASVDEAMKLAKKMATSAKQRKKEEWRSVARAEYSFLDPEVIFTSGSERMKEPGTYLLLSSISSAKSQMVRCHCARDTVVAIYLKSERQGGDTLKLERGDNELLLVYASGKDQFSRAHYGAFFRLLEAKGEKRADVRYEADKVVFREK